MTPTRPRGRPRGDNRISYNEAAGILGVSVETISRWVSEGYLPAFETTGGYHKLWRNVVVELAEDRKRGQ